MTLPQYITSIEDKDKIRGIFIDSINLDQMIKDIGLTATKGTIADWWLKVIDSQKLDLLEHLKEEMPHYANGEEEPGASEEQSKEMRDWSDGWNAYRAKMLDLLSVDKI